ncbi:unnamed protein product [Orchesella dallaii]|uniref:Uncharacterized protein n=1 Tax=Orchesella dallaii TaxID=48710 RepID=A0ABP1RWD4_9HEXA
MESYLNSSVFRFKVLAEKIVSLFDLDFWIFDLANFYNGIVTSLLIQPIPVKMMEVLGDLVVNNYSLVFPFTSPTVYGSTLELLGIYKNFRSQICSHGNQNGKIFPRKLSNEEELDILMANPKSQYLPDKEFLERVAYGQNSAAFGPWLFVYRVYQRVMHLIESRRFSKSKDFDENRQSFNIKRSCFVGKKMITGITNLWTFYPPNSEWIFRTFLGFAQNGIDKLWVREFYGLNYAKRVQDRGKILSPISTTPDADLRRR